MEKRIRVVCGCGRGGTLESGGSSSGGGEASRDEASEGLEDSSSAHEFVKFLDPVLGVHAIFLGCVSGQP